MGLNLGALLGAAATAGQGYLAGRQARADRDYQRGRQGQQDAMAAEEHRLRMQALAQSITQGAVPQPSPVDMANLGHKQRLEEIGARQAPATPEPTRPVSLSPGSVLVDPTTGKPLYRNPAAPTTPTGPATGVPTESERRAGGLLMGAQQALNDIHGLLRAGYNPMRENMASRAFALSGAPKMATATASTEGRLFRNAVKRLVTNYLYVTSGATANPGEIASQAEQTTTDLLDNPETLEQKLRFLDGKVEEMRAIAGRAAPPMPQPVAPAPAAAAGKNPADRWEELVAGGMGKAEATAQVRREFGQ